MSGMEDKILGKEKTKTLSAKAKNAFEAQAVWKIKRQGCGVMITNGVMVAQMLNAENKAKVLKGAAKITEADCFYERLK